MQCNGLSNRFKVETALQACTQKDDSKILLQYLVSQEQKATLHITKQPVLDSYKIRGTICLDRFRVALLSRPQLIACRYLDCTVVD